MIRIALPPPEADRLDALFRSTADRKLRDRLQIVLMAHRGHPRQDIAADLGVDRRTVTRWVHADSDAGLDGLRPKKAPGTPGKIPPTLADPRGARRPPAQDPEHPDLPECGPAVLLGDRHPPVTPDLPARPGQPRPAGPGQGGSGRPGKRAAAGELVRLTQDEARFPIVPTLAATLGVKGHRPTVGTLDNKDLLYLLAVINLVTAAVHANTRDSPKNATKKTGRTKTRRMQDGFAAHLRHIARVYPADRHPRVVLVIDNAPWHRGKPIDEALRDHPHLAFYRLPSYSPQLNPLERFWKKLRRRATHTRLFDTLADLKTAIRASLSHFQTVRHKVRSIIQERPKRKTAK